MFEAIKSRLNLIKFHFKVITDVVKYHSQEIWFITRYSIRDRLYFKRLGAEKAYGIYINYRDKTLKSIYKNIRSSAKRGFTSFQIRLHDQETAEQFKKILEKDGFLVKIENLSHSTYSHELLIKWSDSDIKGLGKYL